VSVQHGEFDIAIVGGGSAGFAAAIKGAELGARVALIEGGTLGGTCVNVGCVPSKTLIRAAEAQHRRVHHGFRGVPATDGQPDWPTLRAEKDALVTELRQSKYWNVLRATPRSRCSKSAPRWCPVARCDWPVAARSPRRRSS